MVIWSKFRLGEYRDDDHREDAHHFTWATNSSWYLLQLHLALLYVCMLQPFEIEQNLAFYRDQLFFYSKERVLIFVTDPQNQKTFRSIRR